MLFFLSPGLLKRLGFMILAYWAGAWVLAEAAQVMTLTISSDKAHLRAQQQEQAEVVAELKAGDKLKLLANSLGNETWYLVQTETGLTGWIPSRDTTGAEKLEKMIQESDSPATTGAGTSDNRPLAEPSLKKEISVPIRTDGAAIIVPVELNRTITTYMVMDTGATLTVITPSLAKRLGLKFGPRIAAMLANGAVVTAPTARVNSVRVGSAEVHGVVVSVQNFSPHPQIEGLLGLNFFSRFRTSIDSRTQRLILAPR